MQWQENLIIFISSGAIIGILIQALSIKTKLKLLKGEGNRDDMKTIENEIELRATVMKSLVELYAKAEELLKESSSLKAKIVQFEYEQEKLLKQLSHYSEENSNLRLEILELKTQIDYYKKHCNCDEN